MNLFCRGLSLHRWGTWTVVSKYLRKEKNNDLLAGISETIPYWLEKGEWQVQQQECIRCGLKRSREVRA